MPRRALAKGWPVFWGLLFPNTRFDCTGPNDVRRLLARW